VLARALRFAVTIFDRDDLPLARREQIEVDLVRNLRLAPLLAQGRAQIAHLGRTNTGRRAELSQRLACRRIMTKYLTAEVGSSRSRTIL
jgi:hypothetical protein